MTAALAVLLGLFGAWGGGGLQAVGSDVPASDGDAASDPAPDALWGLLDAPTTQAEEAFVVAVLDGCTSRSGVVLADRRTVDPFEVLALLRLGDALGLPSELRGALAAWRCLESAYRPASDLYGDSGAALGPMQLHAPWIAHEVLGRAARSRRDWLTAATFGGQDWRRDTYASARAVAFAITAMEKTARRRCPGGRSWVVAEAMVGTPGWSWRCDAETWHVALARQWSGR